MRKLSACGLKVGLLATLACMVQQVHARQDADLTDLSLERLLELRIISTPKFGARAQDIPSSVSIITATEIRTFGWRTLADMLRSLPGFNVTDDHGYSYVGVRGLSVPGDYRPRLQLLIDGIQSNENIYDGTLAGSDFPLDVELIDHVEVVRGPSASTYGGNSMAGIINVITRRGADIGAMEASASIGSGTTRQLRATWGSSFANGAALLMSATGFDAQGRSIDYPEFGTLGFDTTARGNDAEQGAKLLVRATGGDWRATLIHSRRDHEVVNGAYGTIFNGHHADFVDTLTLAEIGNDHHWNSGYTFSSRLFAGRYADTGVYPFDIDSVLVINRDRLIGKWWGGEARVTAVQLPRQRVTAGIEYQDNFSQHLENYDVDYGCYDVGAEPCLLDRRSNRHVGIYLEDKITLLPATELTLGVRYDQTSSLPSHWSQRLGVVHHAGAAGTFKFLYATAFRDPSVSERYYNWPGYAYGNPAIRPEQMRSSELTWEKALSPSTRFTLAGYHFSVERMISQSREFTVENLPALTARGIELEVEHRWSARAQLKAGYSLQSPVREGDRPDNSPEHSLKLNLSLPLPLPEMTAGIETQVVSTRLAANGAVRVGGHVVTNLNLNYSPPTRAWELTFGVYNLFDRQYADPVSVDQLANVPVYRMTQNARGYRLHGTVSF